MHTSQRHMEQGTTLLLFAGLIGDFLNSVSLGQGGSDEDVTISKPKIHLKDLLHLNWPEVT